MSSGQESQPGGTAFPSKEPPSVLSPQHVKSMWGEWQERERHRLATAREAPRRHVADEEPPNPSSPEDEPPAPPLMQDPIPVPQDAADPIPGGANPVRTGIDPSGRAKNAMTGQRGLWQLGGLVLIGGISLLLAYTLNKAGSTDIRGGTAPEPIVQRVQNETASSIDAFEGRVNPAALSMEKPDSSMRNLSEGEHAALDRMFTFKFDDDLQQQKLTVNGCDAVLTVDVFSAISGNREKRELSRFDLRRFHLADSEPTDSLTLVADAEAGSDLLLWYDALAGEPVGEEDLVQSLLLRADAGEFGSFVARNRQETQIFSGDRTSAPLPRPLLEVSIRLPQEGAAPAMEAWRSYVRDHCRSG